MLLYRLNSFQNDTSRDTPQGQFPVLPRRRTTPGATRHNKAAAAAAEAAPDSAPSWLLNSCVKDCLRTCRRLEEGSGR